MELEFDEQKNSGCLNQTGRPIIPIEKKAQRRHTPMISFFSLGVESWVKTEKMLLPLSINNMWKNYEKVWKFGIFHMDFFLLIFREENFFFFFLNFFNVIK